MTLLISYKQSQITRSKKYFVDHTLMSRLIGVIIMIIIFKKISKIGVDNKMGEGGGANNGDKGGRKLKILKFVP